MGIRVKGGMIVLAAVVAALFGTPVMAQWTSDPAANLPLAVKPDSQVQPKVVTRADGGAYASWFDSDASGSPAFGYDVYLQRLDALGNKQWAEGGILVADRGFSSTQDYGLDIDSVGNALLAFRDDRFSGVQITAARVEADGTLSWGSSGVQVTSGIGDRSAPKIAGTSDGKIVVAWTEGDDVVLQRLDALGNPLWGAGVTIPAPSTKTYSLSDLHGSDGGAVIVSWVRSAGLNSDRHLLAQKISADGLPLWGMAPVVVFDGGSLQMGNFPGFVPDGHGGAVFGWYKIAPDQCYAQRILPTGAEAFPHNGTAATATTDRDRTGPAVSFDPDALETFLFWSEASLGQQGVYGQKFDKSGSRQWGDSGAVVRALGPVTTMYVANLQIGAGASAYWIEEESFANDRIYGARLDGDGTPICDPFLVSSLASNKSRLAAALNDSDMAILAWSDERNGNSDIYAQNVNADCSLGGGGGVVPGEVSPPGAAQPLVFTDKVTLLWEEASLSGSDWFNLYRGDVAELAPGQDGDCLEPDIPTNTTTDSETPAPGSSFFYLVTGETAAGEGPMGSDSEGIAREPVTPCP